MCITASVGRDCDNARGDVKTIQILLNMNISKLAPLGELDEDGICGDSTINAIEAFQKLVVGFSQPDSKINPGGKSLGKLAEGIPSFCDTVLSGIYVDAAENLIQKYCSALSEKMADYSINTRLRMAHFLAQVGHESGELRYSEEIASGVAYEGRTDIGNTQPGDGPRFKGRGLIQLTGRANYTAYSEARGIDYTVNPELLSTDPAVAVDVSCWFWIRNGLNELADNDDVIAITRRINGGLNGLDDRKAKLVREKFFIPPI